MKSLTQAELSAIPAQFVWCVEMPRPMHHPILAHEADLSCVGLVELKGHLAFVWWAAAGPSMRTVHSCLLSEIEERFSVIGRRINVWWVRASLEFKQGREFVSSVWHPRPKMLGCRNYSLVWHATSVPPCLMAPAQSPICSGRFLVVPAATRRIFSPCSRLQRHGWFRWQYWSKSDLRPLIIILSYNIATNEPKLLLRDEFQDSVICQKTNIPQIKMTGSRAWLQFQAVWALQKHSGCCYLPEIKPRKRSHENSNRSSAENMGLPSSFFGAECAVLTRGDWSRAQWRSFGFERISI